MKYGLFIAAICLLCHSCIHKQTDDSIHDVVVHYHDSVSDTYKQRAAQFLIDNMDVHYTLQSEGIDSFRLYMDSIFRLPYRDDLFYNRAYDTAVMRYAHLMEVNQMRIPDTSTVTAEYLKANIDSAFRMWRTKWNMDYGFGHFCNYVLPYSVGHEPLSQWREKYIAQQLPKVDKFANSQENYYYVYGTYSTVNRGIHAAVYYPKGFAPDFPATMTISSVRASSMNSTTGMAAASPPSPAWRAIGKVCSM